MAGAIRCAECHILIPTMEFADHQDEHLHAEDLAHQGLIEWLEGLLTVEEPTS